MSHADGPSAQSVSAKKLRTIDGTEYLRTTVAQAEDLTQWLATLKARRYVAPSWARKSSAIIVP